jgi:hypothetical protein
LYLQYIISLAGDVVHSISLVTLCKTTNTQKMDAVSFGQEAAMGQIKSSARGVLSYSLHKQPGDPDHSDYSLPKVADDSGGDLRQVSHWIVTSGDSGIHSTQSGDSGLPRENVKGHFGSLIMVPCRVHSFVLAISGDCSGRQVALPSFILANTQHI